VDSRLVAALTKTIERAHR
jgi:C-terminal processing protease CtpA/Prc